MKKYFTSVRILTMVGIIASSVLVYNLSFAQNDDKDKKKSKIEKRIEIIDENGEKKVTVTTIENGKKKVETYTGKDAEDYLKLQNNVNSGNMHMSFDFDLDTVGGKNSFDFKIDGFSDEFEKGIQEMVEELKKSGSQMQFDFKNLFKDLDSNFSNNNFKSYSFNFDDTKEIIDSIMNEFKFDIHINDKENEIYIDEPKKKTVIVSHSVVIEDLDKKKNAEKDLHITDLSFYPNPNGGMFNLKYKSESMDLIDISVIDLNGKTVYNERISAIGTVIRNIELEQPSGTYILNLKQGKKHASKKLIIQ